MLARHASHAGNSVDPVAKVRGLIRRKASERDRLLKEIAECESALLPLEEHQRTLDALDGEIHELFRGLLAGPKLSKRAREQVRELYEALQDDQAISLDPGRAAERARSCSCPVCTRRRAEADAGGDEPLDAEARGEAPRVEPAAGAPDARERDASVRALYRKLAFRFHPDRAEDNTRRAEHEAVMREVNEAYHEGDTERLLRLSRELGIDVGELEAGDGVLAELVRQYERVKAEVRAIRHSPLGALVVDVRRARQRGDRSPIAALAEQVEIALASLAEMRDFTRQFAEGKIGLDTFLDGPRGHGDLDADADEEGFFEFLDMLGLAEAGSRGRTKSARGKANSRGVARGSRKR